MMWLGEQITSRGIGNGTSLIIFAGIVAELPTAVAGTLQLSKQGAISAGLILMVLVMGIGVIALIVFFGAGRQRRLLINYPKRQVGNRVYEGQTSFLPLKLNTSGVIPPIFASSLLLLLPTTVTGFAAQGGPEWLQVMNAYLGHGRPLFMLCYAALIIFFAFFYTAIVFNPVETADNLKKHGGLVGESGRASEDGAVHRPYPVAHHGYRRALSDICLSVTRTASFPDRLAVLLWRHLDPDRRLGDHGYGGPGAWLFAGPSVRGTDQEEQAQGKA